MSGRRTRDRTIAFSSYGVTLRLGIDHHCAPGPCRFSDVVEQIDTRLPPGAEPIDPAINLDPATTITVRCDGEVMIVHSPTGDARTYSEATAALGGIDQTIRSTLALAAPGLVFIHAGSVAVDGHVVVLPGRSMVGKTTLVAALLRNGARYLSDEYAVVDTNGMVHPYARPLSVREQDGRRGTDAGELGSDTVTDPMGVGLIAEVAYDSGGSWQVHDRDQAACAQALIANAVAAQHRPDEVLAVCARLARSTRFVAGTRGDATDAAARLIEAVHRHHAPAR